MNLGRVRLPLIIIFLSVVSVVSSLAIISLGKRELVALLHLPFYVLWQFLFLRVPWVGLQCVIVAFPGRTHLLCQRIIILLTVTDHPSNYTPVRIYMIVFFVWYESLRPINNLSVKQGPVFLGWTTTKLGKMCLAQGPRRHCAPNLPDITLPVFLAASWSPVVSQSLVVFFSLLLSFSCLPPPVSSSLLPSVFSVLPPVFSVFLHVSSSHLPISTNTVKPVFSDHSKRSPKLVFKADYLIMQVKSIAECFLQYFRPSLSYH